MSGWFLDKMVGVQDNLGMKYCFNKCWGLYTVLISGARYRKDRKTENIDQIFRSPNHAFCLDCPAVLGPKKNGTLRFSWITYALDAMTTHDAYTIPWMDKWIDSLGDVNVLRAVDEKNGCSQIDISLENWEEMIFTTRFGAYYFTPMPLRLYNPFAM